MEKKLAELKMRLLEADDLSSAASVLYWDQSTYMPAGGAPARARQMATLGKLAHEKFVDPAVGRLLDELRSFAESLPYDSDEASLIRVTRRDYERAVKVPATLVAAISAHGAASHQVWAAARPESNFAAVRPYLEKTVDYSRQIADCFPGYDHIADPLIDYSDEGMRANTLRPLFSELRQTLVPLAAAIASQPLPDDSCLRRTFAEQRQLEFGRAVVEDYGYDFERGRQDKSPHPYMTKFSIGDVRITTRVNETFLNEALFSTLHEAGHGMYEQGIDPAFEGMPIGHGASAGVHESQSRLWENLVGRSRGFWSYYYPRLQKTFPGQLDDVSLDGFYRAINKVAPSLIRVEADEVTYNLHVMIRFELELELLEGTLEVADLPEAWHRRYESDLGIVAPDDREGVLQDIHWYGGLVGGAFQGYTLGNIMSALFFQTATAAHPEIAAEIESGQFETLRTWLTENIYRRGRKLTAAELMEAVSGDPLTLEPYRNYLHAKFGEIYPLESVVDEPSRVPSSG